MSQLKVYSSQNEELEQEKRIYSSQNKRLREELEQEKRKVKNLEKFKVSKYIIVHNIIHYFA